MKSDKPAALPPPIRPGGTGPRPPRPSPQRPLGQRSTPLLDTRLLDTSVRHWFDEEVEALQRLAHTQRLKGDYVAAQALEREIRTLAAEMRAIIQTGSSR